ncbi:contractile injection system protein, VgrG/Pvc8 family [Burkholderia multivorans]|uniref:contractile injection system protein, VgrG/Pvc8 family n=1 Tax=Burkholderia multivorans TaxID=87883 RepID=UPI003D2C3359
MSSVCRGRTQNRSYCTQYKETDLEFAQRLNAGRRPVSTTSSTRKDGHKLIITDNSIACEADRWHESDSGVLERGGTRRSGSREELLCTTASLSRAGSA